MAHYQAVIETSLRPQAILDYMADFANAREWDPGVSDARALTPGAPRLGSEFELDVAMARRSVPLRYRIVEFDSNHVRLVAQNSWLRSDDTIGVTPTSSGTTLTYDAHLALTGAARIAQPLLGLVFDRVGDRAAAGLAATIERMEAADADTGSSPP